MGVGDVNGDHYDDFLIGVPGSAYNNSNSGLVYLVLGKASGWKLNDTLSIADASFSGETIGDCIGYALSGNGDVDGDGYNDILIGSDCNSVVGHDAGKTYLVFPDGNKELSSILSIKAYSDSKYTQQISTANIGDTLYLELDGVDSDSTRQNIALVNISSAAYPVGFQLRLYETNATSGIYRGNFSIMNHTEKNFRWFKAYRGDTFTISSIQNPNIFTTINISGVTIIPIRDITSVNEDDTYNVHYSYVGHSNVNWHFMTNASWLSWDNKKQVVSGIPDNSNVGLYRVTINVTDGTGYSDEHEFILRVINRPPKILTKNINSTLEDHLYLVDYNSSEDGQGRITWHLKTDAKWLSINSSTGILSGTPRINDVGTNDVNVSVDDGNGSWNWTNFNLTVIHVNHRPQITTQDDKIAYEHTYYSAYYRAIDIDARYYSGKLNWSFVTNASWLTLDPLNASFYGTPDNGDVGSYYVNVTVRNPLNASDFHNFTLTVINYPPSIRMNHDNPVVIFENENLSLEFNSDDKGENRTSWQFKSNASWLSIDKFSGNMTGIPRFKDIGTWSVNVTINDGNGGYNWINFTIIVHGIDHPPSVSNISDQEASVNSLFTYHVNATDIDKRELYYYLIQSPTGMRIDNTGLITWTPTWKQDGQYSIMIDISDLDFSIHKSFTIVVHPWGGHLLIIVTTPLNNQTVKGLLTINGTISGPNGTIVWIETENMPWTVVEVNDNDSWTYKINTTMLSDGNHTFKVRATWGDNKYSSDIIVVNYYVKNKEIKTNNEDNGGIIWIILLILFILGSILMVNGFTNTKSQKNKRIKKLKKSQK